MKPYDIIVFFLVLIFADEQLIQTLFNNAESIQPTDDTAVDHVGETPETLPSPIMMYNHSRKTGVRSKISAKN